MLILKAIAELAEVENRSSWRIPVDSLKKNTNWACEWTAKDDAMLLVGAWRHGFGSWEAIQQDEELGLEGKFFLEDAKKERKDTTAVPAAPEDDKKPKKESRSPGAIHLVRRADYLLRTLKEAQVAAKAFQDKKGPTSAPTKPEKKKRVSNKSKEPKEKDVAAVNGTNTATTSKKDTSKKRRATPEFTSSESEVEDPASMDEGECKGLLRPVKHQLKQLKTVEELPREEKVVVLKECLMAVGSRIQELVAKKSSGGEKLRKHLWIFTSWFWPKSELIVLM